MKRRMQKVFNQYPVTATIHYCGTALKLSTEQIAMLLRRLKIRTTDNTIRSYRLYNGGKPLPKVSGEHKKRLLAMVPKGKAEKAPRNAAEATPAAV
jgi:hypothetical protein